MIIEVKKSLCQLLTSVASQGFLLTSCSNFLNITLFFLYAFLSAFHVLHLLRSLLNGEGYFLALVGTIHQIPVCRLIKATWWPFEPGDASLAA